MEFAKLLYCINKSLSDLTKNYYFSLELHAYTHILPIWPCINVD